MPESEDRRVHEIVRAISAERIEHDVRLLAGFGTRHTLSDTTSEVRGIGAARRWVRAEFERIAAAAGGALQVEERRWIEPGGVRPRIPVDTELVNVLAVLPGAASPPRYLLMSGDIDSRASDPLDGTSDAPGANDNASGLAALLEVARVLAHYRFDATLVFAALSGEEQGLVGGHRLAEEVRAGGWNLGAVLNNDMVGNTRGIDGIADNRTFRIFSEPTPFTEADEDRHRRRLFGGEVDGPSRQLARYVEHSARRYVPDLEPMLVYRLDRFGRGGHHRPFNDLGFTAVRIMEAHEHFDRQHQDVRVEDGRAFGDVAEHVDFAYAARLAAVNAATLASLGWAPPAPRGVEVSGAGTGATTLRWDGATTAAAYKLYWRLTTEPRWTHHRLIEDASEATLDGVVIDNYFFGVAALDPRGNESVVSFAEPPR